MPKLDKYNMVTMLNRDLERAVKEASVENIVNHQLKEFEEKIRPIVKAEVDKLTFKGIAHVAETLAMRDDFRIWINWSDEDKMRSLEAGGDNNTP